MVARMALRQRASALGFGLLAVLLIWGLTNLRAWHAVEFKTYDLWTTLSAAGTSPLPIVILAIDEPTFDQLQTQWPFPRRFHARVLERLRQDGARAVAFDVVFAEPSNPVDDLTLSDALRGSMPVVLAATRDRSVSGNAITWSEVAPMASLLNENAVAGQAQVQPDPDYVIRRHVFSEDSFAVRLARAAGWRGAPEPGLLRYIGPSASFATHSYYQALEPGLLPPGFFKDKIVLVGRALQTATDRSNSQDMFVSPFAVIGGGEQMISGVEVQANLSANLIAGNSLRPVDEAWTLLLTLALLLILAIVGGRVHPGTAAALTLALMGLIVLLSWWLFTHANWWLAPLFPIAAMCAFYGTTIVVQFVAARQRARETRQMFSQYVPETVVARLIDNPALLTLGGETRELTLMFTDLADFTNLSEKLEAPAVMAVLTEYFNVMTPIIHRHGGTVDKFIGDAIMAFWGAPLDNAQHAVYAVRAAIEMDQAMLDLSARLVARGMSPIGMRIGLHSGTAVVGNAGSLTRFAYTAVGDAVNLAARLEGANKAFGSRILVSGATVGQLPPGISMRHLDTILVKGRAAPVPVFTPCPDRDLNALSAQAIAHFAAREFDQAEAAFRSILTALPGDLAAQRFIERIAACKLQAPGPDWYSAQALEKL
jgi:adenylate cyclase